ncbi:MAG: hypothetical protein ACK4WH_01930 [Phycisphaerales bacterium]
MSVTLYVSCTKSGLPSRRQWQSAIDAAGFDLVLDEFEWKSQSGFLGATFCGVKTGFELWVEDAKPLARQLHVSLPRDNDVIVSFVFGADKAGGDAAACASAALARCACGLYFDEFSDDLLDGETAVHVAQDSMKAD